MTETNVPSTFSTSWRPETKYLLIRFFTEEIHALFEMVKLHIAGSLTKAKTVALTCFEYLNNFFLHFQRRVISLSGP